MKTPIKLFIVIFFLTSSLFAQQTYNANIIASLTGGPCEGGLFEHSNRVYLGANKTLIILDTTNPSSPVEINQYYIGLTINQVFANDELCVLSTRTGAGVVWFFILDISNAENIIKLCEFPNSYEYAIDNMVIKENLLIIPTRTNILFYDIVNPSSPQLLNFIPFEESNSHFEIVDDYAIINHFNHPYDSTKILIYDISDIYAPQLVSTFPESGFDRRYSFEIRDSILLSFGEDLGVVNISNPLSPYEVSNIDLPSYCYSGVSRDTILFLKGSGADLYLINFTNITTPSLVDTVDIPELSTIRIAGQFLYVAKEKLDIYDTSDPTNLTLTNAFEYFFNLDGIHLSDGNLFTINLPNQIRSIDLSDPQNPYYRNSLQLNFNIQAYPRFTGNSNYLFLAEITDKIHIFNISDKDTIVEISEINIPMGYFVRTVYTIDSILIVSYEVPSFTEVYDITDPFNPHFLSSFGDSYYAVAMDSAFFFGVPFTGDNIDIFDLTDSSHPIFAQNVLLNVNEAIRTLDVSQKVMSISTGYIEYKLIIYEIDDYYNPPLRRGTFNTNGDFSLLIQRVDDFIFLHHGTSYLSKINISDLSYPNEVAMFNENFNMRNFWIENDIAYAVSSSGLLVIDFNYPVNIIGALNSPANEFLLENNYPNPFNPTTKIKYQIPELSIVTLKVYDVLGNEIAALISEEKPTGSYEVEFDAINLPSGIYFYRLQAGSFVETKKMVLMK